MNIICSIIVVVNMGGVHIMTKSTETGVLIAKSEENYVGNFSEATKKYKDVIGNYANVLVPRSECVELND